MTVVTEIIKEGFLVSPEIANELNNEDSSFINFLRMHLSEEKPLVINKEFYEKSKKKFDFLNKEGDEENSIMVLDSFREFDEKKTVNHFVEHYKVRYSFLRNILSNRKELENCISINRLLNRRERNKVSLIGIVADKNYTKNGHIMLTLEDFTGKINVLVSNTKEELLNKTKDVVFDEVIGIEGMLGDKMVFADNLIQPGIPMNQEVKKINNEEYAVFISDIQIGSNYFLEKEFLEFINWINGDYGSSEQRDMAKKIKYLFIVGDLADGVGVHPGQEHVTNIHDAKEQYDKSAEYLSMIRKDLQIIISPGNHDIVRLAEPQPPLSKELASSLWEMPNVLLVPNPCYLTIGKNGNSEGVLILLYHGYSFDYYVNEIESVRYNGGYDNVIGIMKSLLDKRHLAPSHTSSLFIPDPDKDELLITKVPDIFVTGHVHRARISNYSNVTLICAGCWEGLTDFQEKTGHIPDPARAIIVNLKTRENKILKFMKDDE